MKKNFMRKIALVLCLVITGMLCVACDNGGENINPNDNEVPDQVDTSDRSGWEKRNLADPSQFLNKTLNISYFKGGYGDDWLKEMEVKFEAEYPGIEIVLKPSTDASQFKTLLEQKLAAPNTPDDIYICHDIPWQYLSSLNLIADLTNDLYGQSIYYDTNNDFQAIKFQDLVASSSLSTAMFNNKFYKVPLIQGVGGIAYNKTLFDQYGWEIPTTYEELLALCNTIYKSDAVNSDGDKVYPFVFSGSETYLWDGLINAWWKQLAGEEEFKRGWNPGADDMEIYDPSVYPYHLQAYQAWYDLVCLNKDKFVTPGSEGLTYLEADMAFAAGQGAMMPATCWISNEIGADMKADFGCEIGMMAAPLLADAKTDENGKAITCVYDTAGRDSIVVAERGNKQLAIEFLKWLAFEENNELFPKNVDGICMAFKYDFDALTTKYAKDQWAKDCFALLKKSSRDVGYSDSLLFITKKTSEYPLGNYIANALETVGTANAITPQWVFNETWKYTRENWTTWCVAAGLQ
jgi:ABC-type glycerol-3-phosphate transport system substrate-binding protein